MLAMATPSQNATQPANDSGEPELVDRLRYAAMGKRMSQKNLRSAQLAFDSAVDVQKRTRILAHLAAEQPPKRSSFTLKGSGSWLPIPLGILAVMALGAALSQKVSKKGESFSPVTPTVQANEPASVPLSPTLASPNSSGERNSSGEPKSSGQLKEGLPGSKFAPALTPQ